MSTLVQTKAIGRNLRPVNVLFDQSRLDWMLLCVLICLSLFGLVMITSASMPYAEKVHGAPFYFALRQSVFLGLGLLIALVLFLVPMRTWERYGPHLLGISIFFLVIVLIPGIGREVNGSRRWLDLGVITVQVSEAVKLCIIIYLAGYLVRRGELVQNTLGGFLRPLVVIVIAAALLLAEPDFGAAVVITSTAILMLFVAGVRLNQFILLLLALIVVAYLLVWISPYRMARFTSFVDPFADPFGNGFQLTQALIALGSGSIGGVGLGSSVQKLFYLPEAHTDFVFAILGEELGLIGAAGVIITYGFIVLRSFGLARRAYDVGNRFSSYVALGIGVWIGQQAFINIGVNMGVLPTKGITLPMLSYGGSSALIFATAFALLLRIDFEVRQLRVIDLRSQQRSREHQEWEQAYV